MVLLIFVSDFKMRRRQAVKGFKENLKSEIKISGGGFLFLIAYIVAIVVLLTNLPSTFSTLAKFMAVISPFTTGFIFAFLINIPMTFFEKKFFAFFEKKNNRVWNKVKRPASLLISIAIIYFVIAILGSFIYSEIYKSVVEFSSNLPKYAEHFQKVSQSFFSHFSPEGFLFDAFSNIEWVKIAEKIGGALARISPDIINITIGVTNAVFNFVMSLIFALYLLLGKEKLLRNVRMLMRAYLKRKTVIKMRYFAKVSKLTFTKFTVGQFMETVILGTLYFAFTSFTGMPYPALIAVLMAIGGIIPVIGPLITTVPSVLIVLMAGGVNQALWFVLMAIVIQQVESNIIYPKVIGESVGLPGIWVLLSVLIGGSVGGMFGMLIAVPAASVLYTLLKKDVHDRLKVKNKAREKYKLKRTAGVKELSQDENKKDN